MQKILIIEDDAAIRKMLKKFFEKDSYEVFTADNGNLGISLYKERLPDLVITDLIMPEKEGLETIRELKKITPEIKIIAVSGGGISHPKLYLGLAEKLGAVRTFAKPFDKNELVSAVKEILD